MPSVGGQYRFGMKLNAVYVQCAMPQRHDMAFRAEGRNSEAGRKIFLVDNPRVIASDGDSTFQSLEYIVRFYGREMLCGGIVVFQD